LLLGCIAGDYADATDLASMLLNHRIRTVQHIDVLRAAESEPGADAMVVARKSRTPVRQGVSESLAALAWMRAADCRRAFFKHYWSFDRAAAGNIGAVADALLTALGAGFALSRPMFRVKGRSVYNRYLSVGGVPLRKSRMESSAYAGLGRQFGACSVAPDPWRRGLVSYAVVKRRSAAIRDSITALAKQGARYAIVDGHFVATREAAAAHVLITDGSDVAMGLPANVRRVSLLPERPDPDALLSPSGAASAQDGSRSRATQRQLDFARGYIGVQSRSTWVRRGSSARGQRARSGVGPA